MTVGRGFVDLALEGDIDLGAAAGMSRLLDRFERLDAVLLVHLRDVGFLDCAGLEPLMVTARRRSDRGMAQVRVCDASRPVRRLLRLVGSNGAVLDVQAWDHFGVIRPASKAPSGCIEDVGPAEKPWLIDGPAHHAQAEPVRSVGLAGKELAVVPLPGDRVYAARHGVDRLQRVQVLHTASIVARSAAAEAEERWSAAEAAFDAALDAHRPMLVLRALDREMGGAARRHREARARADRVTHQLTDAVGAGSEPDSALTAADAAASDTVLRDRPHDTSDEAAAPPAGPNADAVAGRAASPSNGAG